MSRNAPTHRLDPAHFGDILAGFVPLTEEEDEAINFDPLSRRAVDRYRCTSWGRVTPEIDVILVEDVLGAFTLLQRWTDPEQFIVPKDTPLALDIRALDDDPNAVTGIIVPVFGAITALPYEMRSRKLPVSMFTAEAIEACTANDTPPFRPKSYISARDLGDIEESAFEEARDFFRRLKSWLRSEEGRAQQGEPGGSSIPQGTALARILGRK